MSTWWMGLVFALVCMSIAQQSERPGRPVPADLVSLLVGSPLSAEQVEERVRDLPDGSSTVEVTRSMIYRDSAGRMRIEGAPGDPNKASVIIIDPASGARIVLSTGDRIAYRVMGAKAGEDGFAYGTGGMGEGLPSGDWRASTEKLGRRTIEGIEVEGQRVTQTATDQPRFAAVHERWYSVEFKLSLLAISSGPGWAHTARLHSLNLQEPDAALFAIPRNYTIREVKFPRAQDP